MSTRWLVVLVIPLFCACSGDASRGGSGQATAALSAPGLTPVPCGDVGGEKQFTWNGTRVELLLADAFAGCASHPLEEFMDLRNFPLADRALKNVAAHMAEVQPSGVPPVLSWAAFRAEENNNCDPDNIDQPRSVKIEDAKIEHVTLNETLFITGVAPEVRPWIMSMADMDLRWAGLNLCMAMRLRERSPGTAGAEALLMTNAEQRELLEATRERSQIAMLQYALLGSVFASDGLGSPPLPGVCIKDPSSEECGLYGDNAPGRHTRIPYLQYFGRNAPKSWMDGMGQDFATAVQLHTTVTQEITSLLARSRSARLPRGGDAESVPDETWGAGSWQQRLMAADYGGDPLGTDAKSPWKHPFGLTGPAAVEIAGAVFSLAWPTRDELPYDRQEAQSPQIESAVSLMQTHDVLNFALEPPSAGNCRTIDVTASSASIYTELEKKVREALCLDFNPATNLCTPVSVPVDPDQHGLFLYYRIRPEHVTAAVRLVSDLVGPKVDTGTGNACTSSLFGSHDVVGTLASVNGNTIHVSPDTKFVPRQPQSVASVFGRYSNTRFAPAWQIDPTVPSQLQGFSTDSECVPIFGGCILIPGGRAAEQQRTMGAIRALVATRELVASAVERLRNPPSTLAPDERLNDYFAHADAIMGVAGGAVGTSFTTHPIMAGASVFEPAFRPT